MSELPRVRRWIETILRGRQPGSVKIAGVAPNTIVESRTRQIGIDYAAVLGACIGRLNSRGYHVALIPHSYRENASRSHNNDAKLCERVLSRVSDRNSSHMSRKTCRARSSGASSASSICWSPAVSTRWYRRW